MYDTPLNAALSSISVLNAVMFSTNLLNTASFSAASPTLAFIDTTKCVLASSGFIFRSSALLVDLVIDVVLHLGGTFIAALRSSAMLEAGFLDTVLIRKYALGTARFDAATRF